METLRDASKPIIEQVLHDVTEGADHTVNGTHKTLEPKHEDQILKLSHEPQINKLQAKVQPPGQQQSDADTTQVPGDVSMVTVAVQTDDVTAEELEEMVIRQQLEIYDACHYLYDDDYHE